MYIYIFTFFRFSIHYMMCDRSVFGSLYYFGYHFIISLVTGKNKYEINTLMKKVSYDNI